MSEITIEKINGVMWVHDPLGVFESEQAEIRNYCHEASGLIPHFLTLEDTRPVAEQFEERYGFGHLCELTGGKIAKGTGVYSYPEDPDLNPLMACRFLNEVVHIYHYGIVGIVNLETDTQFVTRMD